MLEYSEAEFAKEIGVFEGTIMDFENGSSDPSVDVLIRISKRFELSLDLLLGNIDIWGDNYAEKQI